MPSEAFDSNWLTPGSEYLIVVLRHDPVERRTETWTWLYDRATVDKLRSICGEVPVSEMRIRYTPTTSKTLNEVARVKGWVWEMLPDAPAPELRHHEGGEYPRKRPWIAGRGVGSHVVSIGAFETFDLALQAATASWRAARDQLEAAARRAGYDPRLPDAPRVLEVTTGETAWDALIKGYTKP